MIIIDIYGLPGCGKSTLTKQLMSELISLKKEIILFNKNEYTNDNIRNNRIVSYIRLLLPKNILFYFKNIYGLNKIKPETGTNNRRLKEKIWENIRLVILHDQLTKKGKNFIVIVDQGIVQDFASFINGKKIETDYIERYILSFKNSDNKILFVNCNISLEESVKRMKSRNRNSYAFDRLDEKDLYNFLKNNINDLNKIDRVVKKNYKSININMSNEIESNVKKIIKEIEGDI